MSTSEPTVESCLKELRGMFPKSRCQVSIKSFESGGFGVLEFDYTPKLYPYTKKREAEIWLMDVRPANSELGIKMRAPTLREAMDQVRAYKQSQEGNSISSRSHIKSHSPSRSPPHSSTGT